MKYIFFGTPEFAAVVLEKLINAGYLPSAVVCNPDEPAGRKNILSSPPVKILAVKNGIPVFQPEKPDEKFAEEIKKYPADLFIVAAYGKIIPKEILDIPRLGALNIHGSLLPKYRGASPIQAAILNGDKKTGATIMKIDEKMDHGPIISQAEIDMDRSDNFETLSEKIAETGAKLLIKIIPDYLAGKIKPVAQRDSNATYTKIIKKEDGKINWEKSAKEIERMTRAFYPWPSAWTVWNGKILKIFEASVFETGNGKKIGEVFLDKNILAVKCGKGILSIEKLQLEGGKILSAREFLNGRKNFIGVILE